MSVPAQSRDLEKFVVRMPPGMRDHIAEEARRNLRSMNAQIIWMLQQATERPRSETAKSAA